MRVTILGGGFAGLSALRELTGAPGLSVRLIDRSDSAVFSPLLPDVVSARLRPRRLAFPLARHCRRLGAEFIRANVLSIDPSAGRVETDAGAFEADFLLDALGCETNYFGFEEARRKAIGLKSLAEAVSIRRRAVELLAGRRDGPVNLVIVGGGYTGFETASHLAYLASGLTRLGFRELSRAANITVLEIADEVLRNVSPRTRRWSLRLLKSLGVTVRTGTTVESFEGDAVRLTDGRVLPRALVVWSPGVAPGQASAALAASEGGRRLKVDPQLRLPGLPRCFAAGDVAAGVRPGENVPLRMGVQFSIAGGRLAAKNILRAAVGGELFTFNPLDPGYLVPLAPGRAAGVVMGREFRGRFPYLLHYFMGVARSWGWSNRMGLLGDMLLGLGTPEV
ncbi:MAG: NAD(P)/FAD-dependent oxidoreductase [Phycisphaerae bacterium]